MVEIISVHIPKTAGSTFRRVIGQIYKPEEILDYNPNKQKIDSNNLLSKPDLKAIHGHFHGSLFSQNSPQIKKITWVRHPITRIISHFCYLKSIPDVVDFDISSMTLIEYAEKEKNTISKYIGNTSNFFYIGIQEFFQEDLKELKSILDWGKTYVGVENRNRFSTYQKYCLEILSDDIKVAKIAALNQEDMELYEELLNIRSQRIKKLSALHQSHICWQKTKLQLEDLQFKFNTNYVATEQDLTYCYRILLGREPDLLGKQDWLNKIKEENITVDSLVFSFLESTEFRKIYFDPSHNSQIHLNEDNVKDYVSYCSKLLLNTKINPDDINKWATGIKEKRMSMIELVREFITLSHYSIA